MVPKAGLKEGDYHIGVDGKKTSTVANLKEIAS